MSREAAKNLVTYVSGTNKLLQSRIDCDQRERGIGLAVCLRAGARTRGSLEFLGVRTMDASIVETRSTTASVKHPHTAPRVAPSLGPRVVVRSSFECRSSVPSTVPEGQTDGTRAYTWAHIWGQRWT